MNIVRILIAIAWICAAAQIIPLPAIARVDDSEHKQVLVYVTNGDRYYHRAECSHLQQGSHSMSVKDAVAAGHIACTICKPPTSRTLWPSGR